MAPNATLAIDHFHWSKGTRVCVLGYCRSKEHVTIEFPPWREGGALQRWTFPRDAVKLDVGTQLTLGAPEDLQPKR